jgi:hypothetical protein
VRGEIVVCCGDRLIVIVNRDVRWNISGRKE